MSALSESLCNVSQEENPMQSCDKPIPSVDTKLTVIDCTGVFLTMKQNQRIKEVASLYNKMLCVP